MPPTWPASPSTDDLQVLMAAQVASLYCSIRTVEARLLITRENVVLQKRSLEIAERLFKSGNDSELDLQQARAQYFGTLSAVPQLEAALRQTQNCTEHAAGRASGPAARDGGRQGSDPASRLDVIADIPADLLRRRPDVRAVGTADAASRP
jgi:outer membrane protein TolC